MANTTELEAVNDILMSAGMPEVADLGASTLANVEEADQALSVLRRISRELQSTGLHCNTEYTVTLSPTVNEILITADMIRVDKSDTAEPDVCVRDDKLYNLTDHTFTFTEDVECDIVYLRDYEDLPEHVRRYILARAARTFVLRYLRDTELWQALKEDETHARQAFTIGEIENSDTNMLEGYPSNQLLHRSPNHGFVNY